MDQNISYQNLVQALEYEQLLYLPENHSLAIR